MSHADARTLRRAAHVLKRLHVGAVLGVEPSGILFEETGAPRLAPPFAHMHVSLSHTEGAIAVAVDTGPVGIDVERVRRDLDWGRLAMRRFAPGEGETCAASAAPLVAFTRAWCAKEALLKAHGLTLSEALSLDCAQIGEAPTFLHGAWVQVFSPAPDVYCALARRVDRPGAA